MATRESLYQKIDKHSRIIRLLRILPEPHPYDGRLDCSLITVCLNQALKFYALSYTWGEPDSFGYKIWINEILVPVRQNLLCALRVLRANNEVMNETELVENCDNGSAPGDFYIWVDALCINQKDDMERGHQVAMMGDIYRNAYEVIAWLGTPDLTELSCEGLDFKVEPPDIIDISAFELVTSAISVYESASQRYIYSERQYESQIRVLESFHLERAVDFEQLSLFCYFQYWSRLWILRQLCLARRVTLLYGRKTLNWSIFGALRTAMIESVAWDYLMLEGSRAPEALGPWIAVKDIMKSRPWDILALIEEGTKAHGFAGIDLKDALIAARRAICHDRRDKVFFGTLGMTRDVSTGDIAVDYSINLFEVYSNTMAFLLRSRSIRTERRVICSQLIQDALLGPNFEESGQAEMRSGRLRHANESLPTLVLEGYAESIIRVWDKGISPQTSRWKPATRAWKPWSRTRTDHLEPDHDMLIQRAWEADKHVLHSLLDAEDPCDRPSSLGLT